MLNIEHNHEKCENQIDIIMIQNGYRRVFKNITDFDGWYVRADILAERLAT